MVKSAYIGRLHPEFFREAAGAQIPSSPHALKKKLPVIAGEFPFSRGRGRCLMRTGYPAILAPSFKMAIVSNLRHCPDVSPRRMV